jgi:hypothetical protein
MQFVAPVFFFALSSICCIRKAALSIPVFCGRVENAPFTLRFLGLVLARKLLRHQAVGFVISPEPTVAFGHAQAEEALVAEIGIVVEGKRTRRGRGGRRAGRSTRGPDGGRERSTQLGRKRRKANTRMATHAPALAPTCRSCEPRLYLAHEAFHRVDQLFDVTVAMEIDLESLDTGCFSVAQQVGSNLGGRTVPS